HVRDGRSELDVAHAVSTNFGEGHFDAAFLADDAAILHALVLAAQAFVVLDRPKDPSAEQAVALRLERPVVDRLRLLDFAERPRADLLRAGKPDLDRVEVLVGGELTEQVQQSLHASLLKFVAVRTERTVVLVMLSCAPAR